MLPFTGENGSYVGKGVGTAVGAQAVNRIPSRTKQARYLGWNMSVILPKGGRQKETSNDFVIARLTDNFVV